MDQIRMQTLTDGRRAKMWRLPNGEWIEVGDNTDVGAEIGVLPKTYSNYVRWGSPKNDPAPGPIGIDPSTRRDLFPMDQVRAWHKRRPGPGDHTGVGARRRWDRAAQDRAATAAAAAAAAAAADEEEGTP